MASAGQPANAPQLEADVLRRGTAGPDTPPIRLTAGPVVALLDGIDLRDVGVPGCTLLDRVYVAVRDKDWNTIPMEVSGLHIRQDESAFEVTFEAHHVAGGIDYAWNGTITGSAAGVIYYAMSGQTRAASTYCRIGFCLLHPDSLAGATYEARTPGGLMAGWLPRTIAPQMVVDGFERALFEACESLTVVATDGTSVTTEFSGDLFEMEDQRNWTDASFKTYCTPIARGYPHEATAGQRFEQTVTIRVGGTQLSGRSRTWEAEAETVVTLAPSEGPELPAIGLGMATEGGALSDQGVAWLKDLALRHLRTDVHPSQHDWQVDLEASIAVANDLDVGLEVALHVPSGRGGSISDVAAAVSEGRVSRWLIFDEETAGTGTTPSALASEARAILGQDAVIVAGTNGDFAEINRSWPDLSSVDGVTYAINPRVHASDDRSLMENSTAQGATVSTTRSVVAGRAICVSPVTLAPRFNPAASGSETAPPDDALPPSVDVRQLSLLAAAWTVSSIASLAGAGADSVTYFETAGWRGIIGSATGSPMPARFPSTPGWAFPVFHVFAQLGRMRPGTLLVGTATSPRAVAGIAARRGHNVIGLAANLQPEERSVAIGPFARPVSIRVLDETTALRAGQDPGAWPGVEPVAPVDGLIKLALRPYATVMFEEG